MKKIIILICFIASIQNAYAQNTTTDSLQAILVNTTKPIDRFTIINKIMETTGFSSGYIDTTSCIEMLKIAQQLKNDSLLATAYNWIGSNFGRNQGNNIAALEYYFKAIPLAEKAKDMRRLSSVYFDISGVYFNLQNNEAGLKYARKGWENLPDKSHPLYDFMLAQYQRGVSTFYILTNQPDSALRYSLPMTETSRRAKSLLFEFNSMHLNGAAYAKANEKELADVYFRKALAVLDSIRSTQGILRFGINYIPFLLANNRLADAKVQAVRLLNFGEELGINDLKLAGAGYMRQVFDSLQNRDSAYYYARMEAEFNARIFSQNNINKTQALAFNEQIRLIEDEAKKTEQALQRKQNIQYALLALGIIIFVILFLALSRRHITNTKLIQFLGVVALLVVFEFLNLLLHPLLERITHHNPILMLLALVCIAALLVPLHHKLEKWATHKLVEKNKTIRLAAAKKTIEELEKK